MRTFPLSRTGLAVPAVVTGCMRIQQKSDAEVRALYEASRSAGIDFFDHADIYGAQVHGCEQRFGDALRLTPSERAEIVLQSKAGILLRENYFDFSYEHIVATVEESLRALGTDYLDILLLHRPDALCEPEEVARAFNDLATRGLVRHFGVSNHTPAQIDLLRAHVDQPIVANQVQLSIAHCPIIAQPMAANIAGLEQSSARDAGIVDYCRLHGITLQAWSPVQAPNSKGVFLGHPDYPELNAAIDRLAAKYGVTPDALPVAWITRHPANIQVVTGTTNPQRLADSALGAELPLTRPEWYELFKAAGHIVP